jgi:hypothetical protein
MSVWTMLLSASLLHAAEALPSVGSLSRGSDLIVVGQAASGKDQGAGTPISILVVRAIKGAIGPGETLNLVRTTSDGSCIQSLPSGLTEYGVWFLNRDSDGRVRFSSPPSSQSCDPFHSDYEMPKGEVPAAWSYQTSASPEDKLASELAWSIESHNGDGPRGFLHSPRLLEGCTKAALQTIYKQFSQSAQEHLRISGLLGLVRLGDVPSLILLQSQMSQIVATPLRTTYQQHGKNLALRYGEDEQIFPTYEAEAAAALESVTNTDAASVAALESIVSSGSSSDAVRRAAAKALAKMHTAAIAGFLAPLLKDPDHAIVAAAVSGLACFASGVPAITPERPQPDFSGYGKYRTADVLDHFTTGAATVEKNENYYVAFWSAWWSANAASVANDAKADQQGPAA